MRFSRLKHELFATLEEATEQLGQLLRSRGYGVLACRDCPDASRPCVILKMVYPRSAFEAYIRDGERARISHCTALLQEVGFNRVCVELRVSPEIRRTTKEALATISP